jgi:hypothetical protein
MTLQEFCDSLPKDKQITLAVTLTKQILPIWDEYAEGNILTYRDTVVGLTHTVPKQLLADSIKEVEIYLSTQKLLRKLKNNSKLLKLYSYFGDPIVALWDSDWELPEPVQKIFYSVYNLLGSIVDKNKISSEETKIYVSINQAIDAIETSGRLSEDQIKEILKQAKNDK